MLNAIKTYENGGVLAYPTEAVFGLGCDPDNETAVEKLLTIKQRPVEKGLILLAASFEQLKPYVDISTLSESEISTMLSRWPDGISQVLPASTYTKAFITGKFNSIAVRVTSQPDVVALCNQLNKPIVSTSANLTGLPPASTWQQVEQQLADQVDYIIKGDTLGFTQPSKIIDAISGEVFRA